MRRSPLAPIFLIVLVDILGLTLMLPLLPFYAEHFGASPLVVTLLATTYAACQLVAGPLLGRISDRTGRRPLLLVSQAGTFAGFLLLAFAQSLWMVFLARVIDGLTAGNLSLAQAYISDVTRPKDRAGAFALIGIAFGVGFLVGPGVSGWLAQYGLSVPVFAAAGLSLTSIACTFFLLPSVSPLPEGMAREEAAAGPPAPAGRRLSVLDWGAYVDFFRRPGLAALLVEFFLFALMFALFTSGFALFAERRFTWRGRPFGPKQVGLVFAYAGFLGIILQGGLIRRLVRRFGEGPLIGAGFLSAVVGYGLLGFTRRVGELIGVATVASFGSGVLRPSLTSLITQRAGRHEQGVVLGLTQSLQSVGQIVGPLIAGSLIERGMLTSWALAAAAVSAVALALHVASTRSRDAAATAPGIPVESVPPTPKPST